MLSSLDLTIKYRLLQSCIKKNIILDKLDEETCRQSRLKGSILYGSSQPDILAPDNWRAFQTYYCPNIELYIDAPELF